MSRKNFNLSEKNIKGFLIRQAALIIGIVIAASILNIVKTVADTVSADTVVESVAGQFSGRVSKLEMDVAVKTVASLSGVINIISMLVILVLGVLLVMDWIPIIRKTLKIINARSKE